MTAPRGRHHFTNRTEAQRLAIKSQDLGCKCHDVPYQCKVLTNTSSQAEARTTPRLHIIRCQEIIQVKVQEINRLINQQPRAWGCTTFQAVRRVGSEVEQYPIKPWPLHSRSSFRLMYPRGQHMMVQVFGPLSQSWETWMEFWAPGFNLPQPSLSWESGERSSR